MGVTALVMAGGRGTRMKLGEEKALLKIGGKPMIEHVLNSLMNAEKVDRIVVAVSSHTHRTAKWLRSRSVEVLETSGESYVYDMQFAAKRLGLEIFLTISADLPLITSRMVDEIVGRYEQCRKPALVVAVPFDMRRKIGEDSSYIFEIGGRRLVPAGINMIDGKRINEMQLAEEVFVIEREEVAANVNTLRDLEAAERLFHLSSQRL